jgi:hypothetical protein
MNAMSADEPGSRTLFEAAARSLEGLCVSGVDYWDIHNFGPEPSRWDYGDWHHAVMGVQLMTDAGPRTVTWTNRFYAYGVEVFPDPIERHLVLGDGGPERIGPIGLSRWSDLVGAPIRHVAISWDRFNIGPAVKLSTREVVGPARSIDVPTAVRLDFEAACVWFVAAQPSFPSLVDVFIPGDEIMVVFSGDKMRSMGYTYPGFVP